MEHKDEINMRQVRQNISAVANMNMWQIIGNGPLAKMQKAL